ncbi:DUF3152 domain-containing protein [Jatrophihabitans fulvus]
MTAERRGHPRDPSGGYGTVEEGPTEDVDVRHARGNLRHATPSYGRPSRPPARSGGVEWLRTFVRRYGWRAYALPILTVVTIVALATTGSSSPSGGEAPPAAQGGQSSASTPPMAGSRIPLKNDDKGNLSDTLLKAAALPPGPAYTKAGNGTFRVLPGSMAPVGTGQRFRYSIDVENGVTGVNLTAFAAKVDAVMSDKRSWAGHGVSVQRVGSWKGTTEGTDDFHVTLTSSMTVRTLCGYDIPVETSCFVRAGSTPGLTVNRVVYNVARWVRGAPAYLGDLDAYRTYMINHENGHALGHGHAHQCLPGGLSPVMLQQTFGLRSAATGKLCEANPWPYPPGVRGTPGAEQPDTPQNSEYGKGD